MSSTTKNNGSTSGVFRIGLLNKNSKIRIIPAAIAPTPAMYSALRDLRRIVSLIGVV